ncbi:MAG: DUF5681 domain-containing protein, partial [Gammaproteobacteria bacterium]
CKNHIKTPIYLPNRTENRIEQGMARSSTTFKPGVSGNPGGRPKVLSEVRDLAREHTVTAIDTLVSIMCNEKAPAAASTAAAQAILDRGYGKPSQAMKIEEERQMFVISGEPLSEEEWERRYCDPARSALNTRAVLATD